MLKSNQSNPKCVVTASRADKAATHDHVMSSIEAGRGEIIVGLRVPALKALRSLLYQLQRFSMCFHVFSMCFPGFRESSLSVRAVRHIETELPHVVDFKAL